MSPAHIQRRFGLGAKEEAGASTVRPLPPAARYWFEEAETAAPWDSLLEACSANFSAEGHGKSPSFWRHALEHWLRRSGAYIDCLRSVPLDPRSITDRLVADIRRTDEKVTLLALLEGVQFTRATMDFSDFTIVRPTAANSRLSSVSGSTGSSIPTRLPLPAGSPITGTFVRSRGTIVPRSVGSTSTTRSANPSDHSTRNLPP
jgi:hypothetical protein